MSGRLDRLLAMALTLTSRRRVLARELAERFSVSLRTVYRDVQALCAAGFPVVGTAGDGYRLVGGARLEPVALSPNELDALVLAGRSFSVAVQGGMAVALKQALAKLEGTLSPAAVRRVTELERRIVTPAFVRPRAGPSPEMLDAVRDRVVARLRYHDPRSDRRSTREVEPLGFVCLKDAWWLVAYCRARQGDRAFRVDRVRAFRPLDEHFTPREGHGFTDVIARDAHLAERLFGS